VSNVCRTLAWCGLGAWLGLLTGCASAPDEHVYTLIGNGPVAPQTTSQTAAHADLQVAITSVTLPEAVDRAELVLRTGPNSVKILEDRLWVESLKSAIPRVVAEHLGELLDGATVSTRSEYASRDAKYLVTIDITRFDAVQNEAAVVEAMWSIKAAAGAQSDKPGISGRSILREPVGGSTVEDMVAAESRALAGLSGDIAVQIKKMAEVVE
jgi:uncharacterized protein